MSVKFYMNVHVRSAMTQGLRLRGIDVLTAQQDDAAELDDPDLLDRATALGRVLFSQDVDLLVEAAKRQRSNQEFSGLRQRERRAGDIRQEIEASQPEVQEIRERLLARRAKLEISDASTDQ